MTNKKPPQTPPLKNNRALVRYATDGRALLRSLAAPAAMNFLRLTGWGRSLTQKIPQPVQARLRRVTRRSAKVTLRVCGGLAVMALLALALVYGRLYQGPIAMGFLVPALEKALNRELSGLTFKIGGAVVRKADAGPGVEFRLRDVLLLDQQGAPVAQAPLAAIDLSGNALLSGRLAAAQVDLIGPRLFLHFSEDKGLALSFSGAQAPPRPAGHEHSPPPAGAPAPGARHLSAPGHLPAPGHGHANKAEAGAAEPEAAKLEQINIAQALTDLFARIGQRGSASAYLTNFGIRDASVIFDHGGHLSRWAVPAMSVKLVHRQKRSTIIGDVTVTSASGPWRLGFRAEHKRQQNTLLVSADVKDAVPRALASEFPALGALKAWDMPVTASARLDIAANGDILAAEAQVKLSPGQLYAPWSDKFPAWIDGGDIRLNYAGEEGRLSLEPSLFHWGQSYARLSGDIRREQGPDGARRWVFDIGTDDIALAAEQFNLPAIKIDNVQMRGEYDPGRERLALNHFRLQAADAHVSLQALLTGIKSEPALELAGEVSPMPTAFFKLLWPKFIAHGAREWVGRNVTGGKITGGAFKLSFPAALLASIKGEGDFPSEALNFRLDLAGVALNHIKGLPPIRTGRASATIAGNRFILDVPEESVIDLPSGKQVKLASGQFIIGNFRPRIPLAEVHFKAAGEAAAAIDLLDHPPLGYMKAAGLKADMLGGAASAAFSITMPMVKDLKFSQMTLRGKARLEDVRAPGIYGGFGVHGGTLAFDVSEKAIEAQGEVKVNGVPVALAWQRIFDAPPERQPSLRLSSKLDDRAREQLGFNLNHVVRGEVMADIAIGLQKEGPPQVRLEANLAKADVFVENAGWRKPPGRHAVMTFDVERSAEGLTNLQNFRIIGDDIAVAGSVSFNDQRRLTAFHFPNFSFNLMTQLEIWGKLNAQNIWKVEARGASHDGRQFFRSLFSPGKLAGSQQPPQKNEAGIDLHAEIDSVIGHSDMSVRNVTIDTRHRNGKLVFMEAHGRLNGEAPVAARIESKAGEPRLLLAEATDAGAAFRLVGFYPAVRGGEASLKVNLDGVGHAEKTGTLYARNFLVVGDQVVDQVLARGQETSAGRQKSARSQSAAEDYIQFDRMIVPFSVGHGQFVLHDSAINGPLLGATMRGRIDFGREQINLSGTYVPLYGLNAAIGAVPILGDLLTGRHGEGVFGITFAVQGSTTSPNVLVNPVSMVAPGFLRQIFEFDHTPPQVIPPERRAPAPSESRASSVPPITR